MTKKQVERHFATAVFIRHPTLPKILLLFHKKLESWLPPGGHLESDEYPHDGARREVLEEAGVEIEFFPQARPTAINSRVQLPPAPHHIQLEKVGPGHYHIDFVFFAKAKSSKIVNAEGHEIGWFSRKELLAIPRREMFAEARQWALIALDQIK